MPYSIELHSHRLAAWAASRAASVKGCRFTVETGVRILEGSGFNPECLPDPNALPDPSQLDKIHRDWRNKIITNATKNGCTFTHGVAAKLINCYLKVRFVCGGTHTHERVALLHPPIDDLLLKAMAQVKFGGHTTSWREFRQKRWSKFDSDTYEAVITQIRSSLPENAPLWTVEEHWGGFQQTLRRKS